MLEGFILTRAATTENFRESALPMETIQTAIVNHIGHVKRVLVYVDVCHAALMGKLKEIKGVNEMMIKELDTHPEKVGMLMASRQGELAFESDRYGNGHGAFSYFLLRGLNGDADLDPYGNSDGVVTAAELQRYVTINVARATRDYQHPWDSFQAALNQPIVPDIKSTEGIKLEMRWSVPDESFFTAEKEKQSFNRGAVRSVGTQPAEQPSPEDLLTLRFERALNAGRLRPDEPDNASAALQELLLASGVAGSERLRMFENRLLVALENRGQAVMLQYLKGEQEALKGEQFVEAAKDFETALRFAPGDRLDESRAKFCRGRALTFDKQYSQAIPLIEQAIRLDPTGAYAYNALGIAYLEQVTRDIRYYRYAADAFQDAINRAPYWVYPRHNLALALTQRGEFQRAAAAYRAAMDLGPYYSYLPYNLALLYQQIADFPAAKTYYGKARQVANQRCETRSGKGFKACPERSLPLTGLASLEIRRGSGRKARKLLDAALADDRGNLTAAHDKAAILAGSRGHEREAETLWEANLSTDPNHLPSLLGLGGLLSRTCRFSEALPMYRAAVEQLKEYVPAQIGLARALVATGALSEAELMTQTLVQRRPENAQAWGARAEFLSRTGGDALAAWQNALRLAKDRAERKQISERQKERGCRSESQPQH
jgi:tetratricopeptide (TPR) repeat protein